MNKTVSKRQIDIATMATMFIYACSAMGIPITLVEMAKELNMDLTASGSLGFILSIQQLLVLLISGFMAARFGMTRMLRIGLALLFSGLISFIFTKSYIMVVGMVLVAGLGQGFLEALLTPYVELSHPGDQGKKMNLVHSFWSIGVFSSALLFGEILSRGVNWRWIFVGLGCCVLIVFLLFPSQKKANLPSTEARMSHIKDIFKHPRSWILGFALFCAGGAEAGFTYWSASYIQIHYHKLPRLGSYGTAAFALGMIIGRMTTSRIAPRFGLKKTLILSTILALIICSSFFFVHSLYILYIVMGLAGLSIACFWPTIQTYAARVLPVDSTLIMIFLSCFGIPGFSITTLMMGIIGDHKNLNSAFILGPLLLLGLLTLLIIDSLINRKKIDNSTFYPFQMQ